MNWKAFALLLWQLFVAVLLVDGQDESCEGDDSASSCIDLSFYEFDKAPATAKYASDKSYFPSKSFLKVPLIGIRQETHDSKILTFGLPPGAGLPIPISSAVLMEIPAQEEGKKAAMRPYNPIFHHSNKKPDTFDLLIKTYLPDGIAGNYVANTLQVGDSVGFKQTKTNIKRDFQFPFEGVTQLTMLAGGTGIAPLYQALVPILQNNTGIQVKLLYGNKTPQDIMLKSQLDELAAKYPSPQFTLHYIVGNSAADDSHSAKDFLTGWIDEAKIQTLGFPSKAGAVVWLCGVDAMYNDLAGSRMNDLTEDSVLYKLGYRDDTVWRS